MKKLIILLSCLFTLNVFAQDDKTVTLVVSGQGKTQEEARQIALRNAIEQAYGAFMTSSTYVLNDKIISDDILTLSNGYIKNYRILNTIRINDQEYEVTINASVVPKKLISYFQNKGGINIQNQELFVTNLRQIDVDIEVESKSMKNIAKISREMAFKSFNFKIEEGKLKSSNGDISNFSSTRKITVTFNKNIETLSDYVDEKLKLLSMSRGEQKVFNDLGLPMYETTFNNKTYLLRNKESLFWIKTIGNNIDVASLAFKIIDKFTEENGINLYKQHWRNLNQTLSRPKINLKEGFKYATYEYTKQYSTNNIANSLSVKIIPERLESIKQSMLEKKFLCENEQSILISEHKINKLIIANNDKVLNSIEYPLLARSLGIENHLDVIFYVGNNGNVTDFKVLDFEIDLEIGPMIFIHVLDSLFSNMMFSPSEDKSMAIGVWNGTSIGFQLR